jgi:hypothetical protein
LKNIFYLGLGLLVFIALIKALTDLQQIGFLRWFYKTEAKLIKRILSDLAALRKK